LPALTVPRPFKIIFDSTPLANAGASKVVPSVSISASSSLKPTVSDALNDHPVGVFVADDPIFGTRISAATEAIL
jgi:hypothetical protein